MTARDRRALLAGAVLVLATLGLRLGVAGVRAGRERVDEARQAVALATKARQLVAEGPARQAAFQERARAVVDLAPLLLAGASEAAAAATLAGELDALATRHRVAIARLDPVPDSAGGGGLTRIEVRLQAESDLAGLSGFVHAVEHGALLLSFTDLAITAEDGTAPVERLRFEASVRGWTLRSAGAAGAAR
jgi:hypothetical protein